MSSQTLDERIDGVQVAGGRTIAAEPYAGPFEGDLRP